MTRQEGDFSKPASDRTANTVEAEYTPDLSDLSLSAIVHNVFTEMRVHHGYHFIADGGPFAGFTACRCVPSSLPGSPEWFTVMRPVNPASLAETVHLTDSLAKVHRKLAGEWEGDDEDANKFFLKAVKDIWSTVSDRPHDTRSRLYGISKVRGRLEKTPRVTISGKPGYLAHVPLAEWFPPQLQGYDSSSLLTLFPEAEKRMLMLVIARAVMGRNGNELAEGLVEHNFRSMALIVGDPGLGKTTLMGYLTEALTQLGFTCASGPTNLNQFAWAGAEKSHLMWWDDMTEEFQGSLLRNNNIKSIVSGGQINIEPKGEAVYSVYAQPAIIALTNVANYQHLIGLDPGVLSRVNHLLTYSREELAERNLMPLREHWVMEAKRLGVSTTLLAMLLIRQCLDLFLEVTGTTIVDGHIVRDEDSDRLMEDTTALRDGLRFHAKLSHADEVTDKVARYIALDIARCKESQQQYYIDLVLKGEFKPEFLRCWLQAVFATEEQPADLYPDHLADVAEYLLPKLHGIDGAKKTRSAVEYFQWLMSNLVSKEGFGYPKHLGYYQGRWIRTVNSIPTWVRQYNEKDLQTVGKRATGVVDYL